MEQVKSPSICQSLQNEKTYVLVVDDENSRISDKFLTSLNKACPNKAIHVDVVENGAKEAAIPNHDIYIISMDHKQYNQQLKLMKTIYKANSKAVLFLVGSNCKENIQKFNKDLAKSLHPTKLGQAVQGVIDPVADSGYEAAIEYVSSVENTKNKLTTLWNKLEEATRKLG
jgi:oligoribonuclease NrnB/cAMP/cGMP phosphodiesterase (DHH superfamily)